MARILGIDVGRDCLRGVVLRSALRRIDEERYIEIPLGEPPAAPGRLPDLREAVESLFKALPSPPDSIVAAVPGELVSLRVVELPTAARKRIRDVLPFELEASLPFDPDEAVLDHQVIESDATHLRLLATAVPREHVAKTLDELSQAGIRPRELAAGAAALDGLCNLLPQLTTPQPILIIDWADDRTDLCFLRNGRCVMARTLSIGMADMPGASAQLRTGLMRTLAAFRASGNEAPSDVYLSGNGAVAERSLEWLGHELQLEVKPLPLPVNHPRGGPAFGKAAALAARGVAGAHRINLRVGEFAPDDIGAGLAQHINLITTCVVAVVMAAMFSLKATQSLLVDEQVALQEQLESVTKDIFDKPISTAAEAELRVKNPRSSDPLPRFDAYDAMAAVSAAVPEEITHEVRRLTIDVEDDKHEGTLELQGTLASIAQRDELVSELEKHPCFSDIERGKTSPARDKESIQYTIEVVVQCPGQGGDKKGKKGDEDE